MKHDAAANAPERDRSTEAPEVDTSAAAPEVRDGTQGMACYCPNTVQSFQDHGLEVLPFSTVSTSARGIADKEVLVNKGGKDVQFWKYIISETRKWTAGVILLLVIAAAVGIGVGIGTRRGNTAPPISQPSSSLPSR